MSGLYTVRSYKSRFMALFSKWYCEVLLNNKFFSNFYDVQITSKLRCFLVFIIQKHRISHSDPLWSYFAQFGSHPSHIHPPHVQIVKLFIKINKIDKRHTQYIWYCCAPLCIFFVPLGIRAAPRFMAIFQNNTIER